MSLQVLWVLAQGHAAQWLNGLALFFALVGAWLMIATRVREQRAGDAVQELALESPALRLNRFFYVFAFATLAAALALSWYSTSL